MISKKIEYLFLRFLAFLINLFGFKSLSALAKITSFVLFRILKIRLSTVISNLKTAFPEKSESEIFSIAKSNYYNVSLTMLEVLYASNASRDFLHNSITPDNPEFLWNAIKENKGVMLVTGHYGNWELGAITAGLYLDKKISVLVKTQSNEFVHKWMTEFRERFGNVVVPVGMGVRGIISVLREKGIVGLVGDQRGPIDGERVKLFNQDTAIFSGLADITTKFNIPLVVLFAERTAPFRFNGIVKEIDYRKVSDDKEIQRKYINTEYMKILEETVRNKPDQWFWMHKIWKY
ncbi:MAG: hypothetical protein K9J12_08745 [Melioribacteraceae bacterium]|nr:hypothetical protein [Melioribacteraceae bacterium]MCF8264634.1 hypothetical protein [Melioribacteraceae bacterium]